ncbi:MAG: hypothetical protein M1830_001728 [Pleopsidium flavum]|nr:MAG: hypothetical protein M1830_001728 [Pleopsidium flavum]
MLSIQSKTEQPQKCTPNVLPCRVHHNGPANATERYWSPSTDADGKKVAYFRGRKLDGKCVKIPDDYRGVVMRSTDRKLPRGLHSAGPSHVFTNAAAEQVDDEEDDEEEEEEEEPVKILEERASFDEVVLWGHESMPDKNDLYAKGIDEWISFAETMHSTFSTSPDAQDVKES